MIFFFYFNFCRDPNYSLLHRSLFLKLSPFCLKQLYIFWCLQLLLDIWSSLAMIFCSDRSMEVKLPALFGNYDRPTTDERVLGKVSLPTIQFGKPCSILFFHIVYIQTNNDDTETTTPENEEADSPQLRQFETGKLNRCNLFLGCP